MICRRNQIKTVQAPVVTYQPRLMSLGRAFLLSAARVLPEILEPLRIETLQSFPKRLHTCMDLEDRSCR